MRGLIITGGSLDLDFARRYLKEEDFDQVITADKGLFYAKELGIEPDVILGDFDSCDQGTLDAFSTKDRTIFPCEKDDTDTGLAVQEAKKRGMKQVVILGATGTRLDHVLGNIGQLLYASENGIDARIVDSNNQIRVAKKKNIIKREEQFGTYISLLPIGIVQDVTLKGFQYPLNCDTLVFSETWGISNVLIEEVGEITYSEGTLLIIESED